ncbi:hypothetical protein [Actinomadura kijaniata]|uniref:hypothetical protein n=1 Tax=Actinomadura kijaniata TaxID=46161 RepID=UPI000A8A996D|nr:hypothetical protein [Actinomadura kijaniata]
MDGTKVPHPRAGDGGPGAGNGGPRGARGEFVSDVTGRPVWRLLLRGLGVYLPGWRPPEGASPVAGVTVGPPAFVNGGSGFGLHLPARREGLEPDREIYVRGREDPSFGIVIAGPSEAVGSRVVDAEGLVRFARRLTFEELFENGDPKSVPYAVRAARAVQNVVFLDRAAGVGLCAEVDPASGAVWCPVLVRIGAPHERTVRAYGLAPQTVRSHS